MAQKKGGPGIQSSAGLIRYFDAEEESALKISPSFVMMLAGASALTIILMRIFWEF